MDRLEQLQMRKAAVSKAMRARIAAEMQEAAGEASWRKGSASE